MATVEGMLESIRIVRRMFDWDDLPPSWTILTGRDVSQTYGIAFIVTWTDTGGYNHEFVGLQGRPTYMDGSIPGLPSLPFPLLKQSLDDDVADLWIQLWPDGAGSVRAEVVGGRLPRPFNIPITDAEDI